MPNSFRNETLRDEIAKIVQIAHVDKLTSEQTADLIVDCIGRHTVAAFTDGLIGAKAEGGL